MFAAHICGEVGWLRQRIDNRYRSPPPKEHAGKRCGDVIHIIRDVKVSEFCTDNHTCMACCKGKPEFCVFPEIKDDLLKQVAKLVPGSTNKKKCYHCYTTFIFLTYGKVGNGVQYRIPQCVIDQIRKLYPDLNGKYKGFISLCPIHKLKKHQAKKKQKKDSYNVGDCALKDSELPLLYGQRDEKEPGFTSNHREMILNKKKKTNNKLVNNGGNNTVADVTQASDEEEELD